MFGGEKREAGRAQGKGRRERKTQRTLSHVVRLEHLTLVGSSISVHGESGVVSILSEVLLGEGDSGAERDLGSNDSVAAEEAVSPEKKGGLVREREGREKGDGRGSEDVPIDGERER